MENGLSPSPFRVIIVGGSITGLTLANMLERAGIDYVLLEKREVAPQRGQSILVLPSTAVIMEQLGVNKTLDDVSHPVRTRKHFEGTERKLFHASDEPTLIFQNTRRPIRVIDRYRFLSSLSGGIVDKTKIREHEGLVSFTETADGVTVRTDKGNVIEGSILVGADGVHSEVRKQLAAQIADRDPKSALILSTGFKTRYACLTSMSRNHFADDPQRPLVLDGVLSNAYHQKERIGTLCSNLPARNDQPGQAAWVVYVPLDLLGKEPSAQYPGPRFGQADIDMVVEKYGHLPMTDTITIKDCYDSRIGADMIAMEENVLPVRWNSGGRVVLLGDAVHKATANMGMGGNLCVDDVCRVVNGLLPLLERTGNAPSAQELAAMFDDTEVASRSRANFVHRISGFLCDFETMNAWYSMPVRWILPWIPVGWMNKGFTSFHEGAAHLDFLPVPQSEFKLPVREDLSNL